MNDTTSPKIAKKFICNKCDYKCSKHSDYVKHLLTLKHKNDDADDILDDAKLATQYFCECGKEYKHRQGLWKHKKTCNKNNDDEPKILSKNVNNDLLQKDNLIEYLIKENAEFKTLIIELIKKDNNSNNNISNNTISNNTINSNNKTFNLSLFLNETCKDALNIGEFVD